MRRTTIYILANLGLILGACQGSLDKALDEKKYSEVIKQNIGGQLICDVHYYNNFHSWDYDIEYSYKDKGDSVYKIGTGKYSGLPWTKDEQLFKLDHWTILKTSKSRDADKVIIGDIETNSWTEYEISPETIEQNEFWKSRKIDSDPGNYDSVAKIEKISSDGQFSVNYTFAKRNRIFSFITGETQIKYKIDKKTGRPEMTEILEL